MPVGSFHFFLSFRLARNLSDKVIIQVPYERISLPDKFYLALSAHILYLFLPDYGTSAISAKLIINKLMQVIPCRKAMRIMTVLMLIDSSYEVIRYPDIQSRSRIGHNIHSKYIFPHFAITSEGFRTSRNDIYSKAGRIEYYLPFEGAGRNVRFLACRL